MNKKLQPVAERLALLITHSKPKKRVSYHLQIGIGECKQLQFEAYLWADESKGRRDILKSYYVEFGFRDTNISIVKKMAEITNIMNGEINPFEENDDDNNK